MAMNTVIYEKRRALGLTQEQVAEYLGVSAPAVHKWEKGVTYPDVTLIPKLARLLKVDLNSLFCFQQTLTQQEIQQFQEETIQKIQADGIQAGVVMARQKIRDYPDCGELLEGMANLIQGTIIMSELSKQEKEQYQPQITEWYERAMRNGDAKIRQRAGFMAVSQYMQCGELDKAQQVLDQLPEPDLLNKAVFQADVYEKKGNCEEAIKLLERQLLQLSQTVLGIFSRLVDLELEMGETAIAEQIAQKAKEAAQAFDTWGYMHLVGLLSVATQTKNVSKSMELLKQMLEDMKQPFRPDQSSLYHCIYKKPEGEIQISEKLLPPLLKMLESDPAYEFLRGEKEFEQLLLKCRKQCGRI